jgi:hypothetical protein
VSKLLYDIWQALLRERDQGVGVEVDCVLIEIEVNWVKELGGKGKFVDF